MKHGGEQHHSAIKSSMSLAHDIYTDEQGVLISSRARSHLG